ncbi:Hok/Gef family protein, partial [Escherichia coli]
VVLGVCHFWCVARKDLCEVRIRTGQTEVAVFTAYEPEE